MANMVTVKLGAGGAVDVYMQRPMDVAVDVSGAYVPVTAPGLVSSGRLVTLPAGAFRVLDTRDRGVRCRSRRGRACRCQRRRRSGRCRRRRRQHHRDRDRARLLDGLSARRAAPERQQRQHRQRPARHAPVRRSCCCRALRRSTSSPKAAAISSSMSPDGSPGPQRHRRPTGCSCRRRPDAPPRFPKHVRHADVGWQHARVPGLRPRQPGVGRRAQPHRYRFDDRRLRHGVPRRVSPGRRPPTSTSTRGIKRSPTMPSSGSARVESACSRCRACT